MRVMVSMLLIGSLASCASPSDATPGREREAQPADAPARTTPKLKAQPPVRLASATMMQPASVVRVVQPVPRRVRLERGATVTIEPLQWVDYRFEAPRAGCRMTANLQGLAGGHRDFEAFLLDDDNFQAWHAGLTPTGASSGRGEKWSMSTPLRGAGQRHLVVSNRFSEFTPKVVKVSAWMDCPAA